VKMQRAIPLAVAIGLGFGGVAIRSLHARTTTPPVYVVIEIDEVTDPNGFEALRQTAAATAVEVQFEDGRYFARTENVTALDGSAPKFIAFDNMTKAKCGVAGSPEAEESLPPASSKQTHRTRHLATEYALQVPRAIRLCHQQYRASDV
jgi:hypothetical protein